MENNTAEDDFTEKLAQEVSRVKANREWQVEYMTLLMREREKYNEGRIEKILVLKIKDVNISIYKWRYIK